MAVVKANYNRRGTQAVKTTWKAAKYYTFRSGPDLAQRVWHTSDGRVALYDTVEAEIAAGARAYPYTYRVVLSTQAVDLGAAGYHQVLAGQFERYYFIEHHNTEFPHAHVIGFRNQPIRKAALQAIRGKVLELEQGRISVQQHQQGKDVETRGAVRHRQERERGNGIDYGGGG